MICHGGRTLLPVYYAVYKRYFPVAQDDYNVIAVDWQNGAIFPYEHATANTRVAGAVTAAMIKLLMDTTGQTPDMFHIIGHSLGAHTAGYAGERISGIAQITGTARL